jgi:integrase
MQTGSRPITFAEHKNILRLTKDRNFRLFLQLLWETGVRPWDLAQLSVDHVDVGKRRLMVESLKWTAHPRCGEGIPLTERLILTLKQMPASGFYFPRLQRRGPSAIARDFSASRERTGIEPCVTIHSYRLRRLKLAKEGK